MLTQILQGVSLPEALALQFKAFPTRAHQDSVLEKHGVGVVRLQGLQCWGEWNPW